MACKVTTSSPYDSIFRHLLFVPSTKILGSRSSGFRSVNQLDRVDQRFEHFAVKIGALIVVHLPLNGTCIRAYPRDDSALHQFVPYKLNTICGPVKHI